jgi:formate--tetrahydrofolate ligase
MAILCLAKDFGDLGRRMTNMVVGFTYKGEPVRADAVQAVGAMQVLLRDAIHPNLVQSLEGTPAFVHGGPFANIAQGTNTAVATRLALKLADYVVTEAGFATDLGAEKFIHIKCRTAGLKPAAAVIVATTKAINLSRRIQRHRRPGQSGQAHREHPPVRPQSGGVPQPFPGRQAGGPCADHQVLPATRCGSRRVQTF